jgi:hypothetical protein
LIEDLPRELREEMRFVYATDIKQVLDAALEPVLQQEEGEKAGDDLSARANRPSVAKAAAQAR